MSTPGLPSKNEQAAADQAEPYRRVAHLMPKDSSDTSIMHTILTTLAKYDINKVLLHGEKQKKISPEKPVEEPTMGAADTDLFYTNVPDEDEHEMQAMIEKP